MVSIMPKSPLWSVTYFKGYEKHHILNGRNRSNSEKYGLFIWINEEYHQYLTDHPLENLKLKQIAQKAFNKHYPELSFIDIFKRNYL